MRVFVLVSVLVVSLLVAQAETMVKPGYARARAQAAVQELIELNQRMADDLFHQGELEKAVVPLRRIIALDPKNYEAYPSGAWLLWSTGHHTEAQVLYQQMVTALPNDPDAFFDVAFYYDMQKNYAEALTWAERAVALGLPSPKRHLYGQLLEKLGKQDEAIAFWSKVLTEEPNNKIARQRYGGLLEKTGRLNEALDFWQKTMTADPADFTATQRYGRVLALLGRSDEAIAFWQRIVDASPTDDKAKAELDAIQRQQPQQAAPTPAPQQPVSPPAATPAP